MVSFVGLVSEAIVDPVGAVTFDAGVIILIWIGKWGVSAQTTVRPET